MASYLLLPSDRAGRRAVGAGGDRRSRADAGRADLAGRSRARPGDGGGAAGARAADRPAEPRSVEPMPKIEAPAEVTLPLPEPKPRRKSRGKPVEKKPEPIEARRAEAAGAAHHGARRDPKQPLAPTPRAPSPGSVASRATPLASWRDLVVARLQQAKRYPSGAEARREQGVVTLSFSVDRNGRVLSRSIARSSGHSALDQEVLAMVQRAQPLPPFPPAMTQAVGPPHGADPLLAAVRAARYSFAQRVVGGAEALERHRQRDVALVGVLELQLAGARSSRAISGSCRP